MLPTESFRCPWSCRTRLVAFGLGRAYTGGSLDVIRTRFMMAQGSGRGDEIKPLAGGAVRAIVGMTEHGEDKMGQRVAAMSILASARGLRVCE